jgi:hypothetical protein
MVTETLRAGFAEAHRRVGLVFLDVIWKVIWFALTTAGVFLVVYRFVSHFQFTSTHFQPVDALRLANAARSVWNNYSGEFVGGLFAVAGMSVLLYLLLEANVRRKMIVRERGPKPVTTNLLIFIGSNLARVAILGSAAVLLAVMAQGSLDAVVAAAIVFVALAFSLSILDTLVRSDAVDLLGADLLGVTGMIGTLLLFETLIGASFLIVLIAGFLNVASAMEALEMLAVTTLVLLIFNFLHSYLLVVRFSAVGIMRRNVIDV